MSILLASQSGAHIGGAYRDFHPIQPNPDPLIQKDRKPEIQKVSGATNISDVVFCCLLWGLKNSLLGQKIRLKGKCSPCSDSDLKTFRASFGLDEGVSRLPSRDRLKN